MDSRTVAVVGLVLLSLGIAPFAVSPSNDKRSAAVPFNQTKPTGLPGQAVSKVQDSELAVPKAEAYYSQYRYVVGYYGVTSLVAGLQAQERREFGRLLTLYVSDFSGTNVGLTEEGYLRTPRNESTTWVPAREAYFVANSSARIPTRETAVIPFSKRSDAAAFARQHGGEVRRWDGVGRLRVGDVERSPERWQQTVQSRQTRADRAAKSGRALLDRPVSTVVGRDAPTIEAAVARAPPNTTVLVPPGTYRVGDVRIRKPLTIRGAGANKTHLVGDRNESVIYATTPEIAITGVSITGVGPDRTGNGEQVENISVDEDSRRYQYYKTHGYGDAAIVFDSAANSYVSAVEINTTSNGVISRNSRNLVVSNLTLYGTKRWENGFIGVVALGSRVIVQDSELLGGKVGVYAYDASGVVVRGTRMEGMMMGVLDLLSPNFSAFDNEIEDVSNAIYIETRSYGNSIVGNRLSNSYDGIVVEGRSNYIARNVMIHNRHGMQVHGQYAVYWRNVLAYNHIGAKSDALHPTNNVTANDFVDNRQYVKTQKWNVLHVWSGNYWTGAPATTKVDRRASRSFRPTGPVDGIMSSAAAAPTLARSPAHKLLRTLRQLIPGLRSAGVVDQRPRENPVRSDRVAAIRATHNATGQHSDPDPWDYVPRTFETHR